MATIFTPEQAADHLQVTRRTIYTWLREGKLPGRKIGGSWRVSEAALEEFLRQPDPQPPSAPAKRQTTPARKTRVLNQGSPCSEPRKPVF